MQQQELNRKSLYTARDFITTGLLSAAYLLVSKLLIGFKQDQVTLVVLFNVCYYLTRTTRKLITGFSIFIVFWIIFDYMKAFPNYLYNTVHIESLYQAEKSWFGINDNGVRVTPNEYWLQHSKTVLDAITGIFYLSWVPVPLAFAAFLFFKNRTMFLHFSLTFLLVNLIGFAIYYIYPAAPPWYVQQHGFIFKAATPGNTAGLEKFDQLFNVSTFRSLYAKSSNVFAAMPSLHSSYPLIVFFYGMKSKLGWINIFFATLMIGIWFSAVYTSHHYVLDVLAGISCAVTGIVLFRVLVNKNPLVKKWVAAYEKAIR
ncbi:phosphatase PAP2 family protein [Sediminibacterium ginsengisoli]|uniref:PAP2 superfamily protein n=1 Tax=Sediminibacterium ginsengisoli TaxID=413434 RepID=A0A1T4RHB2_9BACT|nr:phosphatase PAP2 family protein [Sediminibacterium ginsengisoli]SKA15196.1 PAP2 superfamily protein [Sediminibacterium ginsengisoli]